MNKWSIGCLASLMLAVLPTGQESPQQLRREWTDADTGHRIVRLSDEAGSQSLYFHQNAYTPDGTKLIITTPTSLSAIDLKTRTVEKVVDGRVNAIMTGKKTGRAYYVKAGAVYAVDLDSKVSTRIGSVPLHGSIASVNADETLLAGTVTAGTIPSTPEPQPSCAAPTG